MTRCQSCDAAIIWTKTVTGKSMPIDAKPSEQGNVELVHRGSPPAARVFLNHQEAIETVDEETPLYVSHFITCPFTKEHRR